MAEYLLTFSDSITITDSTRKSIAIAKSDTVKMSDHISAEVNTEKSDSVVFADSHSDIILRDREVYIRLHIKRV